MKRTILFATLAVGAATALPAMSMTLESLPAAHAQGSVTFLTGGVGTEEAAAMKEARSSYPLSLEFVRKAKPRDEYLANVQVTIEDPSGKAALKATSDGPFLLAKLPAGRYTVRAEEDGKAKVKKVKVAAGKHEQLLFEW